MLSDDELAWLDEKVASNDSDRASEIRDLIHQRMDGEYEMYLEKMKHEDKSTDTSTAKSGPTSIRVVTPTSFEEVPNCINLLKEGTLVNLNLTMLESKIAQKSVNFLAGGTYALEGHQERVGENIYLFAPCDVDVASLTGEADESNPILNDNDSLLSETLKLLTSFEYENTPEAKGKPQHVEINKEKTADAEKVNQQ